MFHVRHQRVGELHGCIGRTLDFHHVRALLLRANLFLLNEEYRLVVCSEEHELCGDDQLVDERQLDFVCFEHVLFAELKHFLLAVHGRSH